jgi:hypothetical protein
MQVIRICLVFILLLFLIYCKKDETENQIQQKSIDPSELLFSWKLISASIVDSSFTPLVNITNEPGVYSINEINRLNYENYLNTISNYQEIYHSDGTFYKKVMTNLSREYLLEVVFSTNGTITLKCTYKDNYNLQKTIVGTRKWTFNSTDNSISFTHEGYNDQFVMDYLIKYATFNVTITDENYLIFSLKVNNKVNIYKNCDLNLKFEKK